MVLTLDKIAKEVAQRVGDRNNDRLTEIKRYVEDTVTELTMMLRKGSVYARSTLTVTDNEATLPDNCAAVLKVYDGASTFYEFVDLDQWRSRSERSSALPTVQAIEDVPNWRLRLLNTASGTITVDYLLTETNPSIMPQYYKPLIVSGAVAKYHLNRSEIDRYRIHADNFKKMKNEFKENQTYNDGRDNRMKGLPEIEIAQPNNSLLSFQSNDFISPGGPF